MYLGRQKFWEFSPGNQFDLWVLKGVNGLFSLNKAKGNNCGFQEGFFRTFEGNMG